MAKFARSSTLIRLFKQATTPTVAEGLVAGDLWIDITSTPVLKLCTVAATQTFVVVPNTASPTLINPNIIGTTTNDAAAAGSVGELIQANRPIGSALGLTTGTATTVSSISLTAGDWDVFGNLIFTGGATTVVTDLLGWVSTTATTLPDASRYTIVNYAAAGLTPFNNAGVGFVIPSIPVSVAITTTLYLSCHADFTVSTCSVGGSVYARRRR